MKEEKPDTWTITVKMTVFAGDMDYESVIGNASELLTERLDGTDFMGIEVTEAVRDK